MPRQTPSFLVRFRRIVITHGTNHHKVLTDAPVHVDSKYIYIGHNAGWKYSWKHDIENVSIQMEPGTVEMTCHKDVHVTCKGALDLETLQQLQDYMETKKHHHSPKHHKVDTTWKQPPKQQEPVLSMRRYRRAYGKQHVKRQFHPAKDSPLPRMKPPRAAVTAKKRLAQEDWSSSENDKEEKPRQEAIPSLEEDQHLDQHVDSKKHNDTKSNRLDKKKKRKRLVKRSGDNSDSDDDDVFATTATPPLVTTSSGRIVSPPQTEDPKENTETKNPQEDSKTNNATSITHFFAPYKKLKTSSTSSKLSLSSNDSSPTVQSPTRPEKSPFSKQQQDQQAHPAKTPLTRDTDWLHETPTTPTKKIDSPTTTTWSRPRKRDVLEEDDIVSTPASTNRRRRRLYGSRVKPQEEQGMSRYAIEPRTIVDPRRTKLTPSTADLVLNRTKFRKWTTTPQLSIPKKTHPSPHAGLANLGNTCYLNASVQALCSVDGFVEDLQKRVQTMTSSENTYKQNKAPLATSLAQVFRQLDKTQDKDESVVDPTVLKNAVDAYTDKFVGRDQRDAHEFMAELLDGLHEEEVSITTRNDSSRKHKTLVDDYFCLVVKVSLTCDCCGYTRSQKEMYRHLSIDVSSHIDKENETWSIEKGLQQFFSNEERHVQCEKCTDGTTATQTLQVVSRPKVLLLHLKRFVLVERPRIRSKEDSDKENQAPAMEMTFRKNKAPVEISDKVSLDSYYQEDKIASPQDSNGEQETMQKAYGLASVVHHIGSTAFSGHYTADGLRQDKWITFDDSVSSYSTNKNQRTAYMVLYGPN